MRIRHKRIVITGASSGIGRALALALADERALLTLAARRLDRLEAVAAQVAAIHPERHRPLVVRCDVRHREQVATLVEQAVQAFGRVDVWINNAGASVYGALTRTPTADIEWLLAVNLLGPLYGMLEVLPRMERGGVIVNVGSAAGLHGVPYLGAYSASKAALAALGQSLRAELAGSGIDVMNVYPGYTETEIFARERLVGGGRRPSRPYAPAAKVARAIVRALERGKREVAVAPESRALGLFRNAWPRAVDFAMARIAWRLRQPTVTSHA